MGGDGRKTGRGLAGMEITLAGKGEDGCNFCPRAGLQYSIRSSTEYSSSKKTSFVHH